MYVNSEELNNLLLLKRKHLEDEIKTLKAHMEWFNTPGRFISDIENEDGDKELFVPEKIYETLLDVEKVMEVSTKIYKGDSINNVPNASTLSNSVLYYRWPNRRIFIL